MGGECFNCVGDASKRYTLHLEGAAVIEDVFVCPACVSAFKDKDWITIQKAPVLLRGDSEENPR